VLNLCTSNVEGLSKSPGKSSATLLDGDFLHESLRRIIWRRSLDSPKRAQADKRIVLDENDSEATLPEYHTNGEVFEVVSFRDVVWTLAKHLKPRDRVRQPNQPHPKSGQFNSRP